MENDDTQTPEEDRPEEESSSVGSLLKAAREEKELSIEQLSAELRIEPHFLTALEDDNFDEFPAPVFTKGYIRQYAQRVGLEYGDVLAEYYRQVDVRDVPMQANKPIRLRDEQQIAQWVIAGLILSILVVGFGVWYLSSDTPPPVEVTAPSEEQVDPGMNEETVVEPAPPPTVDVLEEPLPEPAPALDPPLGAETEEIVAGDADPGETPAEDTVSVETLVENAQPAPALEPAAAVAAETQPAQGLPPAPTVEVTITFEQDCWTEVTDASGERFFYGLGAAGAVSSFDAQLPLSFFLGNAGGVQLQLNGRPYPIPADSRQGNLARFVIAEGF